MYEIWRTNSFNDSLLSEFICKFDSFDVAKYYVDSSLLGEYYAVVKDGKIIYD